MKPSWKEISVIVILAVLATYLSFVIYSKVAPNACFRDPNTGAISCFDPSPLDRGWPFQFVLGRSNLRFLPFIGDLIFYFAIFGLAWSGVKFTAVRIRHK